MRQKTNGRDRFVRGCIVACTVLGLIAPPGCREEADANRKIANLDLVKQLHDFCFNGENDCEQFVCDTLLHLDTGNLPGANPGQRQKLVLSGRPTTPLARDDRIEFFFTGELDRTIDPGIAMQAGWKAEITAAAIEYCRTCDTQDGPAAVIYLRGDAADVTFIADPDDEREIYVRVQAVR